MNEKIQFIPDNNARLSLSKKLNLEFNEYMQDWEYEIADSNRIQEFIEAYDKPETSEKEKQSLMEIILASANELLDDSNTSEFEKFLPSIIERLKNQQELHRGTLNYWLVNDFEISKKLIENEI